MVNTSSIPKMLDGRGGNNNNSGRRAPQQRGRLVTSSYSNNNSGGMSMNNKYPNKAAHHPCDSSHSTRSTCTASTISTRGSISSHSSLSLSLSSQHSLRTTGTTGQSSIATSNNSGSLRRTRPSFVHQQQHQQRQQHQRPRQQQILRQQQGSRSVVRFDTSATVYLERSNQFKRDDGAVWYSKKEIHQFAKEAKRAAQELTAADAEEQREDPTTAYTCYARVLTRTHHACAKAAVDNNKTAALDEKQQKQLKRALRHRAGDRFGLEHFMVPAASKDRAFRRRACLDMVLNLQRLLDNCDPCTKWDGIRSECCRISRPSRLLAFCVGQALAAAEEPSSAAEHQQLATMTYQQQQRRRTSSLLPQQQQRRGGGRQRSLSRPRQQLSCSGGSSVCGGSVCSDRSRSSVRSSAATTSSNHRSALSSLDNSDDTASSVHSSHFETYHSGNCSVGAVGAAITRRGRSVDRNHYSVSSNASGDNGGPATRGCRSRSRPRLLSGGNRDMVAVDQHHQQRQQQHHQSRQSFNRPAY